MLHSELWQAIERFAQAKGYSCSGLARHCGLDATAFNKSKRFSKYGQPRWPSSETIAKLLNGTNSTINDFVRYLPEYNPNNNPRE